MDKLRWVLDFAILLIVFIFIFLMWADIIPTFVVSLVILGLLVLALIKGEIIVGRGAICKREEDPVVFWVMIVLFLGLAIMGFLV